MFVLLGIFVSRYWLLILIFWAAALAGLLKFAPRLQSVTQPGEFKFLPDDAQTRQGEAFFTNAFQDDLLGSSVVLVMHRADDAVLSEDDLAFIEQELKPALETLMPPSREHDDAEPDPSKRVPAASENVFPEIVRIRTPGSREIGKLLRSDDGRGALAIVDLASEFMSYGIRRPVAAIEQVIARLKTDGRVPDGMTIALSGSASVGRDLAVAQSNSAHAVERWTLILIVTLLFAVYRAPIPVLIPLATLFISMRIALKLLAAAAAAGWIDLFEGFEVYTMVVAYGAGVDFSMFLTTRFHEEIRRSESPHDAIVQTMKGVGPAIAAAAATVIFGIGMMIFARFGKFHQAGISISFSLFIILCAALTFTPAMLRAMGRWTFWPEAPHHVGQTEPRTNLFTSVVQRLTFHSTVNRFWVRLADEIVRRPGRAWLIAVSLMMPFTIVGAWIYEDVSFGLVNQLRKDAPSVVGTREISRSFSPGLTGPVTMLIDAPQVDFSRREGREIIQQLTETLSDRKDELQISDIRSSVHPLGLQHRFEDAPRNSGLGRILRRGVQRNSIRDYYNGAVGETGTHAARMDIVLNADPFSRDSIFKLNSLEQAIRQNLPAALASSKIYFIGSTASIRDLQTIASGDRFRINALVTVAVFVVLLILIRSLPDSIYLMGSVIFSFLCTLGLTYLVFWALDPEHFDGLDWTVPLFLFTILVAVGQDYNIFLVTRVHEEREHHGPLRSISQAIIQTAAIITSCGVIMAGTFSSLMIGGELSRMTQLGFSLAFGVLLDTLVVRPILVPAYLAWRARRQMSAGAVLAEESATTS